MAEGRRKEDISSRVADEHFSEGEFAEEYQSYKLNNTI